MKKLNNLADEIQAAIEKVITKAEEPVKKVLEFAKKHKRLIFIIVLTYITFKYVFGSDDDE